LIKKSLTAPLHGKMKVPANYLRVTAKISIQERPLMQSIKGRRLIVYACVICWTTRNNQGQSPLSL